MKTETRIDVLKRTEEILAEKGMKMNGLAEGIERFEKEKKKKLPNNFEITNLVVFGEEVGLDKGIHVYMGKIHHYFLFGYVANEKAHFSLFETKTDLQLHLSNLNGLPSEFLSFWTQVAEDVATFKKEEDWLT